MESKRDLKDSTRRFALDIIDLVDALAKDRVTTHMGIQLLRSGTSVGANYCAASKGRSNAELYSKLCICEEEADECGYWLELISESDRAHTPVDRLRKESEELVSIFAKAKKTLVARGIREDRKPYGIREETLSE